MPQTKDIGRLFAYPALLRKDAKRLQFAPTQEIDPPFRRSTSVVLRVWGNYGLIAGWWRKSGLDEEEALLAATVIPGYDDDINRSYRDVNLAAGRTVVGSPSEVDKAKARRTVSQKAKDIDDEWATLSMLGLDK